MRWPWTKKPKPLAIPPYAPPVQPQQKRCDSGIEVQEHDTSQMTQTGIHRAWRKMTGKDDKGD
jgi:hypothetical protein